MSASSALDRLPWGSNSADGNEPNGSEVSLRRDPIMRLVEDFPSLDLTESTGAQPDQDSLDRSSGNATAVDFAKVPLYGTGAGNLEATLCALQEWEGYVVEVGEETFEARLLDVTAGARYDTESASIPLDEVSSHDRNRMRAGSIFRWVIGYERSSGGTRKRVSLIVFRDLPVVTESDLRAGRVWSREIMEKFDL